jgi:hypothetical protein
MTIEVPVDFQPIGRYGRSGVASSPLQLICGEPAGLSRRDKPGGSPNFLTFELQ